MPKCFRQLSLRQKNRRLKAYETNKQQRIVNKSAISIRHNFESLVHTNIPIKQRVLPDDCNSDDFNVLSTNPNSTVPKFNAHFVQPENEANAGEKIPLSNWLCLWKVRHNITHIALSELLNKLCTCGHTDLPKDARTLLNTPRNTIVQELTENQSFFHYGLKKTIIEQLTRTKFIIKNKIILIDLNIDGLPISKSSKSQIWPILGKIHGDKAFTPFVISAYHIQNHLL